VGGVGVLFGEKKRDYLAAANHETVAGEVDVKLDFEDADFENGARFGLSDGHGAREDVAPGTQ
jgi:hypothetical protein